MDGAGLNRNLDMSHYSPTILVYGQSTWYDRLQVQGLPSYPPE